MVDADVIIQSNPELLIANAENAFTALNGDIVKEHLCRRIFKALSQKSSDGQAVSRPVRFGKLCQICETDPEKVLAILNVFRKKEYKVLLPAKGKTIKDSTLIRLTYKNLPAVWERLSVWVDEEVHAAQGYLQLVAAAALFREGKRDFLVDSELADGLKWYNWNSPNAYWADRYHADFKETVAYLFNSMEEADKITAHQDNQQHQSRTWLPGVFRTAIVASIIGVGIITFFILPPTFFKGKTKKTSEASKIEKMDLTLSSFSESDDDTYVTNLARQLAEKHAERTGNDDQLTRLYEEAAIAEAIRQNETTPLVFDQPVDEEVKPQEVVEATPVILPKKAEEPKVVAEITPLPKAVSATPAVKKTPQPMVAKTEKKGQITIDLVSGVRDFAFHPNRHEFIAGCENGSIHTIRIINGELKKSAGTSLKNEQVRSLDYSKDGKYVAIGTETGQVVILKNSGGKLTETTRHAFDHTIQKVGFLKTSGGYYLAANHLKGVYLLNFENDQIQIADHAKHAHIGTMNIGKDGSHILVGDLNNSYIYTLSGNNISLKTPSVIKADANITSLALNQQSNIMAAGLVNGKISLYELNRAGQAVRSTIVSVHRSLVSSLDFHTNGSSLQLVSSGFDQTLALINITETMAGNISDNFLKFKGHTKWVYKSGFSRSGENIISASEDGKVSLWPVAPEDEYNGALGLKR